MILGNLVQQCYNVADTLIVGRFLGADALAAVGSAFTLMTFLTSVLLGLCMGCLLYTSRCVYEPGLWALSVWMDAGKPRKYGLFLYLCKMLRCLCLPK